MRGAGPAGQEAEGALPGAAGRADAAGGPLHHPEGRQPAGIRGAGGAGLRGAPAGPGPGGLSAVAAGGRGGIGEERPFEQAEQVSRSPARPFSYCATLWYAGPLRWYVFSLGVPALL